MVTGFRKGTTDTISVASPEIVVDSPRIEVDCLKIAFVVSILSLSLFECVFRDFLSKIPFGIEVVCWRVNRIVEPKFHILKLRM